MTTRWPESRIQEAPGVGILRGAVMVGAAVFATYVLIGALAATTSSGILWSVWVMASLPSSEFAWIGYFLTSGFFPDNWSAGARLLPTVLLIAAMQAVLIGGSAAFVSAFRAAGPLRARRDSSAPRMTRETQ